MAKKNKAPGVYIDEIANFPSALAEVATGVPVFIGYTEKASENGISIFKTPKHIKSPGEYQNIFGGSANSSTTFCLYESVQLFYENGGGDCHIISTGDYTNPVSFAVLNESLTNSKTVQADLLAIPDAVFLNDAGDFYALQKNMLDQCASLKNRFAIFDTPEPSADMLSDIRQFRDGTGNDNLKWGAAYYPWLIVKAAKKIPPSGAIAGVYARTDQQRGVWKAPANVSVMGILALTNSVTTSIQDNMNIHESGKSINAIRNFTGKGTLVWGARTLNGNDNEWRYVPVRRFFIMVEESVTKACQSLVFEPNDANTWAKARAMIENYLTIKWRQGALSGSKPGEAFYVRIGSGQTMTAQDILEGRMIVEIGMAPLRPAEFIILCFSIKMQQN